MFGNNQEAGNRKPRSQGEVQLQGLEKKKNETTSNYTASAELKASHSRYDKGMELYKSGRVSIGFNGLFKVSGFQVDIERMTCDCPDYKTRKQTCKHLFAAMLFVKNRGKQSIEHLNGHSAQSYPESKHAPYKAQEAHSRDFNKQATITRLAVINSAIELLKTHRKPIELSEVLSLASQLEQWALGS